MFYLVVLNLSSHPTTRIYEKSTIYVALKCINRCSGARWRVAPTWIKRRWLYASRL